MQERLSRWGVGPNIATAVLTYAAIAAGATYAWPEACVLSAVPTAVSVAVAAVLLVLGVSCLAAAATSVMKAYQYDRLVTSGIFSVVRHPVYAAWIVWILPALALLSRSWPLFLAPLVAYAVFRLRIHCEDEYLEQRFGQAYRDYRARVPELIPLIPVHRKTGRAAHAGGRSMRM